MNVIQSLLIKLIGCKRMITLFEDTVEKNTKKFVFKVQQLSDGTYLVIQQSLRRFPDGKDVLQSEKKWQYATLKEMRDGDFKSSRQGKLFLDDQFWIGKLA
ncbi:hypothetical protein M8U55_20750 [Enterobacter hormaechei]|uniref:hypothetical protein n=1 Tax=Enterobacter hormaechei TaxID=158836 RepID=UPI0018A3BD0E|nr:hypothetical protein [Enterobacter hormaechei]BBV33416.1 hypothetical protein STW0522CIT01_P20080 [Citrobacter freundii]HCQ0324326.1 hypothetical protein [Escherichia coli]MCL8086864.1 hypothetical protein [Enterobacter hormaechei]MCM8359536.1 hypothetical protein [Enterobacter hormaechei]MDF3755515.1 hypothetical protein [Enterobacter hormaechei]